MTTEPVTYWNQHYGKEGAFLPLVVSELLKEQGMTAAMINSLRGSFDNGQFVWRFEYDDMRSPRYSDLLDLRTKDPRAIHCALMAALNTRRITKHKSDVWWRLSELIHAYIRELGKDNAFRDACARGGKRKAGKVTSPKTKAIRRAIDSGCKTRTDVYKYLEACLVGDTKDGWCDPKDGGPHILEIIDPDNAEITASIDFSNPKDKKTLYRAIDRVLRSQSPR